MVDSISSTNIQENENTKKQQETIRSLSCYVVYLISDIIHFTNLKGIEEIKIISQNINIRDITYFSFEILKSLLGYSKTKAEAIQPIIEFEDEIHTLNVKADEVRLKQIILNIISNAVKSTKSAWIKLKCSILAEREKAILSISDTGLGIRESEQAKLFNDFHMINNKSVNNQMGSGLGLSICKSLASSMNIEISSTSTFGKGSVFSLAIPFIPKDGINLSQTNSLISENPNETFNQSEAYLEEFKVINEEKLLPLETLYHVGLERKNQFTMNDSSLRHIYVK